MFDHLRIEVHIRHIRLLHAILVLRQKIGHQTAERM